MVEDDKLAESTWLKMVDDSKLLDTWESEESMGQIEINSIERCCSKSPRRSTEQRVRKWPRPRTSSTSGTRRK